MDSDERNDPELKAAITASLHDSQAEDSQNQVAGKTSGVVDLTGDSDNEIAPRSNSIIGSTTEDSGDDDEALKKAIQMSIQNAKGDEDDVVEVSKQSTQERKGNPTLLTPSKATSQKDGKIPQTIGILGLNRKQMEEERLARLAKRKAESPVLSDQPEPKHFKAEPYTKEKLDTKTSATMTPSGMSSKSDRSADTNPVQTELPSTKSGVQYPNGTVKKTWAFSCPRQNDDIKIDEVFQKSDVELAVLSSFMWDTEWLFSKFDTRKTRLLMVMQAKDSLTVSCFHLLTLMPDDTRNGNMKKKQNRCQISDCVFRQWMVRSTACTRSSCCSSTLTMSESPFQLRT